MEWLLLFLLVPAIVVPIVLQFAFAGCSFTPGTVSSYLGFTSITPLSAESVELIWKSDQSPTMWEIQRTIGMNVTTFKGGVLTDPETFRVVDPTLSAGTICPYCVRADLEGAEFSDPATVRTWARVFSSSLESNGVNVSNPGSCIVQRVSPGTLDHGGNMVGVTIRGASNGELVISRATISIPAIASPEAWDSEGMPVDITYGATTVSAGSNTPLKPTDFEVNPNEALLIAFDIALISGNARVVRGVPHTAYLKLPPPGGTVTEAGTENRAGFAEQANELWLIEAIEVATKWLPTP